MEGKWEEELSLDDIHDATLNQGREEGGKRYLFDEVHAKRLRIDYCQIAVLLTWMESLHYPPENHCIVT